MKKYGLFNKNASEIIHKIEANSIVEAIEMFSKIKKISTDDITNIFDIKVIK